MILAFAWTESGKWQDTLVGIASLQLRFKPGTSWKCYPLDHVVWDPGVGYEAWCKIKCETVVLQSSTGSY
jgi:hypothetical protein